ncbi:MAG: hypothetical protein H6813_05890 [Phycisphaeraceae bacterium]|nr:hypothetical protein [Phycisphaeraceae bacterium]MCB9848000.1 hypothetical protein [Phycisphaeraceae bacterium]
MADLDPTSAGHYSGFSFPDVPVALRSELYAFACDGDTASLIPVKPGAKPYLPLVLAGIIVGPAACWVVILNWPAASYQDDRGNIMFAAMVALFLVTFLGLATLAYWYDRRSIRRHLSSEPLLTITVGEVTVSEDGASGAPRSAIRRIRLVQGTVINELTRSRFDLTQVLLDTDDSIHHPIHVAAIGGAGHRIRSELEKLADWLGVAFELEHCSTNETPTYQTLRKHIKDL